MNNTISVIMPIYPSESFPGRLFRKTIDSLVSQTYNNIEIIPVIDGGGCKKNINLVKGLLCNRKIQYFEMCKNHGAQTAMNFGFTKSSGKYVSFHDQDDISYEDRFSKLYNIINDDDDLVGSYINVKKGIETSIKGFDQDAVIERFHRDPSIIMSPAHFGSLLMTRSFFRSLGGFENTLVSDSLFCIKANLLRYFGYHKKIKIIKEPLFKWVRHSRSNTYDKTIFNKKVIETREKISMVSKDIISNTGNPEKIKQLLNIKDNISCTKSAHCRGFMFEFVKRLFPICRSITGDGVRETLNIIKEHIPINIHEVPSGTKVFDWEVPQEWNIHDAYIKDSSGKRIVDFNDNNLHVVGYSEPISGKRKLRGLKKHLYSIPENPDWIPYITSYYNRMWGFCVSDNLLKSLKDDTYEIKIDSSFKNGSLSYGELIIPGRSNKEILFSANICHPSMANNELSGIAVTTYLAQELLKRDNHYTYRFVFLPETIGSITYLSQNIDVLKKNVIAGYVVTCIGDNGKFSYLRSKEKNSLSNRIAEHVLKYSEVDYNLYDFSRRGSDERQYCWPGVDLSIGSLTRSKYAEYPEYHTSADNLSFVSDKSLYESLEKYLLVVQVFENNRIYNVTTLCEPNLGKRGLYPKLSMAETIDIVRDVKNILAYSDGVTDLLSIADKIDRPIWKLFPIVSKLIKHGIFQKA